MPDRQVFASTAARNSSNIGRLFLLYLGLAYGVISTAPVVARPFTRSCTLTMSSSLKRWPIGCSQVLGVLALVQSGIVHVFHGLAVAADRSTQQVEALENAVVSEDQLLSEEMAEGVGFEPTVRLLPRLISSQIL